MKNLTISIQMLLLIFAGCTISESKPEDLNRDEIKIESEKLNLEDSIQSKTAEETIIIENEEEKRNPEIIIPGANEPCDCQFMINWKYLGKLVLLDSLGKEIDTLQNDTEAENYLIGVVLSSDSLKFNVKIKYAQDEEYKKGFLSKNEFIGVFLSNYSSDTINVYENVVAGMEPSNQIVKYDPSFFELSDCKKGWSNISKEGEMLGWIMNRYICSSPYTTCN